MKRIVFLFTALVLILLSKHFYYHRWLGYENIPNNTIFDEHDYPFVGYSFRKTGIPTGWSTMNAYKELEDAKDNPATYFDGISINLESEKASLKNYKKYNYPVTTVTDVDIGKGTETIRIVQPFFDHPIFGSWLLSLGINNNPQKFDDILPSDYRKVPLYLSLITGILIFIFTQLLFQQYLTSLLALIIYSTIPEFIFMSRYALFENILIPLSLAAFSLLIFAYKYQEKQRLKPLLLILASILSGLAFLTKESGIFVIISSLISLFQYKAKLKDYLLTLLPFTLISLTYYTYMYILSPELFSKLLFDQANREWFGPLSFFYSFLQPNFANFPKSGYWLFGSLSLYLLSFKYPKTFSKLFLPYFIYLFVYLFMGGLNYPWYHLPFLPFIVIASAYLINQLLTKPEITPLILFYLLVFSSSYYWGFFLHNPPEKNYLVYRASLLLFPATYLLQKIKKSHFSKIIWVLFFTLVLFQIYQWNNQSFLFITKNWYELPTNFKFPL